MRLDEISRRGFLGSVGATAARAAIPGKEITAVIDTFVKGVGGEQNLAILKQLLDIVDITDLDAIAGAFMGNVIDTALTDGEMEKLQDEVWYYADDDTYSDDDDDGSKMEDDYQRTKAELLGLDKDEYDVNNTIDKLTGLIGETQIKEVRDFLVANNVDPEQFFSNHSGFGNFIKDAAEDAFEKRYPGYKSRKANMVTPGNLVDAAKQAALPTNIIRAATLVSSIIKKIAPGLFTKSQEIAPVPDPSAEKAALPALPAPSEQEPIQGLNDLQRMKDLAGIKR